MKSALLTVCAPLMLGVPLALTAIPPAHAQSAAAASGPAAPIGDLYAALKTIQAPGGGSAESRASALAPTIDKVFDLEAILHKVVGLKYDGFTTEQKQALLAAFRNYTIAAYVDSFKPGANVQFAVDPAVRAAPGGTGQLVTTHIGGTDNPTGTEIDYPMEQASGGWRVTDVLLQGHISQAAAQRAEFRSSLSAGGVEGLTAALQAKAKKFLGE